MLGSRKGSRIAEMNRKISNEMGTILKNATDESSVLESILQKYEAAVESGKLVDVQFDSCDIDGTFTTYDGNVLVVLPGSNVEEVYTDVDVHATARMLNVAFKLNVVSVNREENKVYCEIPGETREQVHNEMKRAIAREISREISRGNRPLVWGKILKVQERYAMVDILGQGILGTVDVSNWQRSYTRSLIGMCEAGEFYQFEITKAKPKIPGKDTAWVLSRKEITVDAWKQIDLSNMQEGTNILVKCIEKPAGKTYWWGVSDRAPGIEIMGDYTDKYNPRGLLLEGVTYKCKIKALRVGDNSKKSEFKVIPFGVVQEDVAKVAAVQSLKELVIDC